MLCIIIDQYCLLSFLCQPNIPKFRGEYFAIQTLFAQVALGDYYMRRTHCTSRKCVYRVTVSGDIISNLLLSRAYFPHLFHIISAKAKKASASLRKPSRSGCCWLGVLRLCHLLKYAQGQRLTHAVAISRWLTLAHAVTLPKYAQKKISPAEGSAL